MKRSVIACALALLATTACSPGSARPEPLVVPTHPVPKALQAGCHDYFTVFNAWVKRKITYRSDLIYAHGLRDVARHSAAGTSLAEPLLKIAHELIIKQEKVPGGRVANLCGAGMKVVR